MVEVNPESEVVATTPLIFVVKRLVAVANETELELIRVEVEMTPLIELVAMLPPVVNVLFEIIVVVAITPFTVLVKIFPVTD